MIIKCEECGHETDVSKYASSSCSECKKNFCSALNQPCFSNYHRKTKSCRGICLTISNPKWIVNLRNTSEK